MKIWHTLKLLLVLSVFASALSARANSISFDAPEYGTFPGSIGTIGVVYDFTDFPMFGGGLNFIYDPNTIQFVSLTQGQLAPDAQAAASPVGSLVSPGRYEGFGIGTFEFFNGMNSAGDFGVFEFIILGPGPGIAECGGNDFCLTPNAINPFVSLAGEEVTDILFANALSTVGNIGVYPFPVPAAVWLMLSGVGVLAGLRGKPAKR